jgi:nucleoside-diphosphate-sugar epimerase
MTIGLVSQKLNYVRLWLQALRKEPLTVYGDGKQTRSFQYVSDLVGLSLPNIY